MPYKVLNYKQSDRKLVIKTLSAQTESVNSNNYKPHLMFLVHERADSIGGVQRHSARLKEGLSNKYEIKRFNWKNPNNKLPLNFPGLFMKTRSNGFGLIYCDDGVSSIVGTHICKPLRKKVVATVHGLDIIASLPGYQPLIKKSLKKLDKVVCVSRATAKKAINHGVEPSKVEVIPNAAEIVPHIIVKNEELYKEIEAKTGINLRNKKVLFSLGRPLKRKGFDRFIKDIFPHLPEDYIYIAAGPKPEEPGWLKPMNYIFGRNISSKLGLALGMNTVHDELVKLSRHPRVYYLNGVSEHLRNLLYAVSDLFILPNRTVKGDMEGFGIVALEAAVRGVPVIATGIEGITDAVIDGENGYCVAEGDDKGMARVILSLIDDPEKIAALGCSAREFTESHFAIDSIVRKYENLFDELLRDGHGKGY